MNIEFNPDRLSKPNASQPATTRQAVRAAADTSSLSAVSLEDKLNQSSTIRPNKVAEAKSKLSDTHYPPDYVLDRIAKLIAARIK